MRVAALYDIHGNLPALEAVLAEVHGAGVHRVVVGGDVVPGPMPGACLDALASLGVPTSFLAGNGESDVLQAARGRPPARVPEAFRPVVEWVARSLSQRQRTEMASWPRTISLAATAADEVLFCHATPRDDNEIFTRLTPEAALRPVFEPTRARVVVCGHTHMQFDRRVGSVRVVNAGSVGMPFGAPGAGWLLLDGVDVELRHTVYDAAAASAAIAASGYPFTELFDLEHPPSEEAMLAAFARAEIGAPR
jgi:predicted phosphodiesterase